MGECWMFPQGENTPFPSSAFKKYKKRGPQTKFFPEEGQGEPVPEMFFMWYGYPPGGKGGEKRERALLHRGYPGFFHDPGYPKGDELPTGFKGFLPKLKKGVWAPTPWCIGNGIKKGAMEGGENFQEHPTLHFWCWSPIDVLGEVV